MSGQVDSPVTWRDLTAPHLHNWLVPWNADGDHATVACDYCHTHEERHAPYDECEGFIDRFYAEHQHTTEVTQ